MSKMLCGGLSLLGLWVYGTREELKEAKCKNMLAAVLSKAKKYTKAKDPLMLAVIYSDGPKAGADSLPELWMPNEGSGLVRAREQLKACSQLEPIIELRATITTSIVYPLPIPEKEQAAESKQLHTILKQMAATFHEYATTLRCTVNGEHLDEKVRLGSRGPTVTSSTDCVSSIASSRCSELCSRPHSCVRFRREELRIGICALQGPSTPVRTSLRPTPR
jgi:hypothetical protein